MGRGYEPLSPPPPKFLVKNNYSGDSTRDTNYNIYLRCLNVKKRAIFLSTVIDNALFSSFQYIGKHHINSDRHY